MSAGDWLDDVKDAEEQDDGDDNGSSLFADNFRQMVGDGDVESLNPQTIEQQIGDVTDQEVLAEAAEVDDREEMQEVYQTRMAELNQDDATENDSDDAVEMGDEGESEGESETGTEQSEEQVEDSGESEEVVDEEDSEDAEEAADEDSSEDEGQDTSSSEEGDEDPEEEADDDPLPDVNVKSLAPDATHRDDAVEEDPQHTLLVWGQEGTGKTHVAHTAPEPVAYIDTEGKADDIADKFDKEVFYWTPDDYQDAADALDQAFDLLAAYHEQGQRGTLVVDSITKMWDWAKQDYQELAFPSADGPGEVDFKSALQGEDDWAQIKRRHNTNFRDRIVESPYHVVFTAMAKEDYNAVIQGADGKPMTPDGEKQNPYVVKDVVRLRVNDAGATVADLHKSARTRRSFTGLEWPEWDDIYGAVEKIADAEKSEETVSVSNWDFDVVDGKPTYVKEDNDDE
jgi:hypothetical protein